MKRLFAIVLLAYGTVSNDVLAQVSIHDGTGTDPNTSSMLDVQADDAGILIPRMTQADRNSISTPATSLLIYQTDNTPGYYYNSGTPGAPVWERLALASNLGDDLGNHIAEQDVDMEDFDILDANTVQANILLDPEDGTIRVSDQLQVTSDVQVQGGDVYDNSGDIGLLAEDNIYLTMDYNNNDANTNIIFGRNTAVGTVPSGADELMRIQEDGNVGIATATPDALLQIGTGNNSLRLDYWAGEADIDALTQGSAFGSLIQGGDNGHIVVGLKDNGTTDAFSILSGSGNYMTDETYDKVVFVANAGGSVGIGTDSPSESLHVVGNARITSLGGGGNRNLYVDNNGVLVPGSTNIGDITGVTAGAGITGGGTAGTPTVTAAANNGLNVDAGADRIQLGGPLVENSTVSLGTYSLNFDMTNTGDLNISEAGTIITHFRNDGVIFHGDDMYWRDGSYTGTNLMILSDDGDDGRLRIYENGSTSIDLDANTQVIFNEQGLDRDFRIESLDDANMFRVNAAINRIGIGVGGTPITTLEIGHSGGQQLMLSRQDGSTSSGDQLGGIGFDCSDGNTPDDIKEASASIIAFASENHGTGDKGGHLTFWTSPTNQNDDTDGLERMRISQNGNVGIGTTNPTYHLHVNGRIGTNAINETSDARLKKKISDLQNALDKVLAMRGVTYKWRVNEFPEKEFDKGLQYGLIAQELEQVTPALVHTNEEGWKSIEYSHLVPLLIEAIKEQQDIIDQERADKAALQGELDDLKAEFSGRLDEIESALEIDDAEMSDGSGN